jgi:hypothetical protein
MALVEKDPKGERKPLDVKLESDLIQRLKEYCRFASAQREKVVRVALLRIFEQYKEFAEYERRQAASDSARETAAPTAHRRGAEEQARA